MKDSKKFIADAIEGMITEYKTLYEVKNLDDNDTEDIKTKITKILDDKFNGILETRYKTMREEKEKEIKQKMREEKPRK